MRDLLVGPFKSFIRISAQVRKELIQVRRRPAAFFSLVLGPFLIMAVFGLGYTGTRRPLDTVVVIPDELGLPRDASFYQSLTGPAMNIKEVATSPDQALADLAAQKLDIVVIAPANAVETFKSGHQAEITVELNTVDPVSSAYAGLIADTFNREVNAEVIKRAVEQGQNYALAANVDQTTLIPADVVAAPTKVTLTNIAPSRPSVLGFAAPAVLALMLQHMAVTLTALSLVRERLSGAMEMFRISPVNSLELVLGKYLGLGLVSAVIAAVSAALLVIVLGVPMLGSPLAIAGVMALLVLASLGLGLIISVVSDSERQAVQLALLLLLASVFFSGFVLPVNQFQQGVQFAAYLLPVTHGITLLQDLMLRGSTTSLWEVAALAALALIFLVVTVMLVRRQLRSA